MHLNDYDADGEVVKDSDKYLPISLSDVMDDFKTIT